MMKSNVVSLIFLALSSSVVCATWKIGTITNYSDLKLVSACYAKEKQKPVEIAYLTDQLAKALPQNPAIIKFNYTVSDFVGGCSMVKATAQNGQKYQLTFDAHPTRAIKAERSSVAKPQVGKLINESNFPQVARVFLESVGPDGKLNPVAQEPHGYKLEKSAKSVTIDIVLRGNKPENYSIVLSQAAVVV